MIRHLEGKQRSSSVPAQLIRVLGWKSEQRRCQRQVGVTSVPADGLQVLQTRRHLADRSFTFHIHGSLSCSSLLAPGLTSFRSVRILGVTDPVRFWSTFSPTELLLTGCFNEQLEHVEQTKARGDMTSTQ